MNDLQRLVEIMHIHLEHVRSAARENEFIDAAEAIRLHILLAEALESWDRLDDEQRAVLADAVHYLVRMDDEEDDLRSPIGFEDDAEVVEAAASDPAATARPPMPPSSDRRRGRRKKEHFATQG